MSSRLTQRLTDLAAVHAAWSADPPPPEFRAAVEETVERAGLGRQEVEHQLRRPFAQLDATTLRRVLALELGEAACSGDDIGAVPREVLHLAAPTVPGLLAQGVAWAIALGAHSQCRPSRDETVLAHFLQLLERVAPDLAALVDVVDEVRWTTPDAAIVHGSDETVALVRERLTRGTRIAAFGSRTGVAVVTAAGTEAMPGWADALALDIDRFRTRGCMSPRRVLVVGPDTLAGEVAGAVRAALAACSERRARDAARERSLVGASLARRDADATALASMASSTTPTEAAGHARAILHNGVTVEVARLDTPDQVGAALTDLAGHLQTAVICASHAELAHLTAELVAAGCSRTCQPGQAHEPPVDWLYEGIGRLRPLMA